MKAKRKRMPAKLKFKLFFLKKGYSQHKCERILKKLSKKIIKQKFLLPNSKHGIRKIDYYLAKMEYSYYAYRISNLKYNSQVDSTEGTSSGTLELFRKYLQDIILAQNVNGENKIKAINILLAQQSNETLYQIARKDAALGEDSLGKYGTIASYVIKNFPKNCDHNLINLAFYWAANCKPDLVNMAIDKISSPKIILSLCLFFRDNRTNVEYAERAIDRIGNIILDSKKKLEEEGESYEGRDCTKEIHWLDSHEASLLYAAHTALEKIIILYADPDSANIKESELEEEERLVQKAIDKMIIGDFLKKITIVSRDTVKQVKCEARLTKIYGGKEDITEDMYRERLLKAKCSEKEQIEAINALDFNKPENKDLASKLAERMENNKKGIKNVQQLSAGVGYAFCLKMYGSHDFMPMENNSNIEICERCQKRKSNNTIDELLRTQSIISNTSNKNQPTSESDAKTEE